MSKKTTSYEVESYDPYVIYNYFSSLKDAVKYTRKVYGFRKLSKVVKEDLTEMLPELRKMLDE